MPLKGLDLNLLVTLDVLLREKSTTRAGEYLHLSQSAVSSALARLREYFNDELLVRAGNNLVLTPLAHNLVAPVHEALCQIESTVITQAHFNPATSQRTFSIMASDHMATVLLLPVVARVAAEAPHVTMEIRLFSLTHQEELDRGAIDFLIAPDKFAILTHPQELLYEDDFMCLVSQGNPLVGDHISREEYLQLGHLGLKFEGNQPPTDNEWHVGSLGHPRRIEIIAPNFSLMPLLVAHTNRIATLPTRLARFYAQLLPVRLVAPPIKFAPVKFLLTWPIHHSTDPGNQWLRAILQEEAARLDVA